jgi:hypothetical protein
VTHSVTVSVCVPNAERRTDGHDTLTCGSPLTRESICKCQMVQKPLSSPVACRAAAHQTPNSPRSSSLDELHAPEPASRQARDRTTALVDASSVCASAPSRLRLLGPAHLCRRTASGIHGSGKERAAARGRGQDGHERAEAIQGSRGLRRQSSSSADDGKGGSVTPRTPAARRVQPHRGRARSVEETAPLMSGRALALL